MPLDRDDCLNCRSLLLSELTTNFECTPNALQTDGCLCLSLTAKNTLQLLHLLNNHVLVGHVEAKNLLSNVLDLGFEHLVLFNKCFTLGLAFPLASESTEISSELRHAGVNLGSKDRAPVILLFTSRFLVNSPLPSFLNIVEDWVELCRVDHAVNDKN